MVDEQLGARLIPMSAETRGHAIKKRMEDLELGPVRLAAAAGVNRKTVARAIEGQASERMFEDIEAALTRLERRVDGPEVGTPVPPQHNGSDDKVVFRLTGIYGADEVIVEAPRDMMEEAQRAVERLLRGVQSPDEKRAKGSSED